MPWLCLHPVSSRTVIFSCQNRTSSPTGYKEARNFLCQPWFDKGYMGNLMWIRNEATFDFHQEKDLATPKNGTGFTAARDHGTSQRSRCSATPGWNAITNLVAKPLHFFELNHIPTSCPYHYFGCWTYIYIYPYIVPIYLGYFHVSLVFLGLATEWDAPRRSSAAHYISKHYLGLGDVGNPMWDLDAIICMM